MNPRRRRLLEGTEVLWSTVTYVPVMICAIVFLEFGEPALDPYVEGSNPAPQWLVSSLLVLCAIGAPLALHYKVWAPLNLLANEIGNRNLLIAHVRRITLQALPYVPLMALGLSLLLFDMGGKLMILQLAVIIGIDHLITRWRKGPIADSVAKLLEESGVK